MRFKPRFVTGGVSISFFFLASAFIRRDSTQRKLFSGTPSVAHLTGVESLVIPSLLVSFKSGIVSVQSLVSELQIIFRFKMS